MKLPSNSFHFQWMRSINTPEKPAKLKVMELILSDHQILDWTDRLYLMVNPEDQRKFTFWPENPTDFR